MIDHVSVAVRDLARATAFYEAVLARIGYTKLEVRPTTVAFGKRYSEFWVNHRPDMFVLPSDAGAQNNGVHVCLRAPTSAAVEVSTPRRSRPAARPTARPACGRITARATMRPSSAIRTATASRR